jgi:hypothetical protein
METMVVKVANVNVFERTAGIVWRWWFNIQAKRRAKRAQAKMEAHIAVRRRL